MQFKKYLLLIALLVLCRVTLQAQYAQIVSGLVIDKESKMPIAGAIVVLADEAMPKQGIATDIDGYYVLHDVAVGKHNITVKMIGYQTVAYQNVLLSSGKQTVLNFEMEPMVQKLKEINISAYDKKSAINDNAMVSARTFDVLETERYAGSRQDPARMASNFAGVSGTDDSRNDIVVRGNSPMGVLWKMDDVDIFNPNHFSIPGSSGGPLSIINNKTLANSDFFTGAFPAEYGNSTAAVFDLKLRNGNTSKYEGTAQFGIMGAELSAEGPISKKSKSSFLVAYRYATLEWLQALHIPIGTNSVPKYQDATIKFNFPINKKTKLSIWGIGGYSNIDIITSNQTEKPKDELYGESDRDQYFTSYVATVCASLQHTISTSSYTKLSISKQLQNINARHNRVYRDSAYHVQSYKDILGYDFNQGKNTINWFLNKRFGVHHSFKLGIGVEQYLLHYQDSIREFTADWKNRWNYKGTAFFIQPYVQYKFKITDSLIFTAGIHGQIFTLNNNSKTIEPRLGLKKILKHNQNISVGVGMHSQLQPMYAYFYHLPNTASSQMHNITLGFTRSAQMVFTYDKVLNKNLRFKTETYYQYLYKAPIETRVGSSFSLLNLGMGFERFFPDTLVNKGKGVNYGVEFTLEKFFSKGFYYMLTGTLFNSKAMGNDGVWRNTDFNGNFIANALGGCEKPLSKNTTLSVGGKVTWGGGKRYSVFDTAKSRLISSGMAIDSIRNQLQTKNYFRADLKLGLRINAKKITHEIAIDLVNILNTKNVLGLAYNAEAARVGENPTSVRYQLGFLPLFYYKIDF